jgi:hypothetical protein
MGRTMCTAKVKGQVYECMREVPDGSEISLCARHLLTAALTVDELGQKYLKFLIVKEGR